MDTGATDVALFVYNVAVVLSGAWLANWGSLEVTPVLIGGVAAAALVWTVYFRVSMGPRLAQLESEDGEDVPERPGGEGEL